MDILSDFKAFVKEKYDKDITIKFATGHKEFASFLKEVQQTSNVIGVTNTSITTERKKTMKFTPPYMSTPLVVLTNERVPHVNSLAQLSKNFQGFTAEVIAGSTHVVETEKPLRILPKKMVSTWY